MSVVTFDYMSVFLHHLSARRERTLFKLNCAAIPTGLLESELFGHERGALTGAIAQRVGRFEAAVGHYFSMVGGIWSGL